MGDTHPRLIRAEDRDRFWRLVDQYKRSGSDLGFDRWVEGREDALEYLGAASRADTHSSDREPLVEMPEDER